MSSATIAQYLLYAAIAVFVIYRQIAPRRFNSGGRLVVLPLILGGYGVYSLLQSPPQAGIDYLVLLGELVVAVIAGTIRGYTIRFWVNQQGVAMQRGTWLTILVWVAFIALRIGTYVVLKGALGTSELMISVGVQLLVQAGITYYRGQRILPQLGAPRQPQPGISG